jgi:nucleotide-binding universal stress UspA family protein
MTRHDRAVIDRGVRIAAARIGLDRVTGVMPTGDPVEALAKLSGDAQMVVVGLHRHTRQIAELWGETALGVIAEAGCPVVVACPEPAGSRGPFAGHVVVGVDDTPAALDALAYGFSYAASHELPLAAVHVADSWPGDFWVDEDFLEVNFAGSPPALDLLTERVEPLEPQYPKVHVKQSVFGGHPATGLLRASGQAALLVVGDRGHRLPARLLLGSVSRSVLFEAGCPVAVARSGKSSASA